MSDDFSDEFTRALEEDLANECPGGCGQPLGEPCSCKQKFPALARRKTLTEDLKETEREIAKQFRDNPGWAQREYQMTAEEWEKLRQWPGDTGG